MTRLFQWIAISTTLLVSPAWAADTLDKWSAEIDQRDVQQAILTRIFGGDLGPGAKAVLNKETGVYTFPKGSSWVRLGRDVILGKIGPKPYLIVSCMFHHEPNEPPINATSYLFQNTSERPDAISAGYAAYERVQLVNLPKLKQSLFVMTNASTQSSTAQWSAYLFILQPSLRPKTVWSSPSSARNFQFGFDDLGGSAERLVVKVNKGNETQFSAYRWEDERFEADSFASESRIKSLPAEVWQFGTR